MSRPKKQITELKMFQINIRVTLEEQLQIEEYSKSFGLSITQFIRIRSLKKQLRKYSLPSINRELFIELCRIGNNLNQLTKKVNQNHPNLKDLNLELLNLKSQIQEIRTAILL